MINLSASAAFGKTGHFVARIVGRNTKFTFNYEFLGSASGKRGETKSADVDDPGLYVERDVDRKGGKSDTYWIVAVDAASGKLGASACDKETAMRLAKALDNGDAPDWSGEMAKIDRAAEERKAIKAAEAKAAALALLQSEVAKIDAGDGIMARPLDGQGQLLSESRLAVLGIEYKYYERGPLIALYRERLAELRGHAPAIDRSALEAERAQLAARIAEIDAELAS